MRRVTSLCLVFVLLTAMTLPVHAQQAQEVGTEPVFGATFDPDPTGNSYAGTSQYIDFVIAHADRVWTGWFELVGLAEPYVYYVVVGYNEAYELTCVDPSGAYTVATFTTQNAYYCSSDYATIDNVMYQGVMYFPLDTMARVKTGDIFGKPSDWPGDFALAMIVAHEFGHHVQDELRLQMGWHQIPTPKNKELIADCFSGVWAAVAYREGLLETGDVEEAIYALNVIGHPSHGTGEERVQAWQIGFYGSQADPCPGIPQNCINAYWL
jgi:uncharacterized protein